VRRRWYHSFARSRATLLKALLLFEGGPKILVINTPWYLEDELDESVVSCSPSFPHHEPEQLSVH